MDNNIPENSNFTQNQQQEEDFDIKRYISLFVNNWYWFAISMFIFLSIAYGVIRYSERIYRVSSTILIKDDQIGGKLRTSEAFIQGTDMFKSQQNLQNEIGILKSFALNLRVIDSLPEFKVNYVALGRRTIVEKRLYIDCPFEVISDSLDYQPAGVKLNIKILESDSYTLEINDNYNVEETLKFGQLFKKKGFNFKIKLRDPLNYKFDPDASHKFYFTFENSIDLARSYQSKLDINPINKDATIVTLSSSGFVPQQETDYLNKLMEVYLARGLEIKNQTADSTIKFIERQLASTSDKLKIAEDDLESFRQRSELINLSAEGALIQNRLERFEGEKSMLELQQKYYEYLLEYLNSKNESGDIVSPSAMGITDSQLVNLINEFADLQQQKIKLAMNLSGNLPPISLFEESINTARKTLTENVLNSLNNIKISVSDVNNRIALVNYDIKKLPATERQLIKIQRAYDLNNTVNTYLLEKRSEAGIAKASNVSDNIIIDKAVEYNAEIIKPKPGKTYSFALFFSLFFPMFCIYVIYNLNNKIIDKKDIETRTKAPILGYISHNDNIDEIPVFEKPGSVLAESFRSIRTLLKYFIHDSDHPVISVTSTISSEGKTFISVNLAAITAMLGKKVLLVGLDLRKPRIFKMFGVSYDQGMSNFLSGNCEYADVIKETRIPNLYYAPAGKTPPNPAELIESQNMITFIETARKEFDIIFIDTPPVAIVTDALLLKDLVDVNIFVVRQRYSSKNTLELIQEYYQAKKLKNIGIIINDINLSGYYGYGVRYGYSMGYGYSYGNGYYGKYSYKRYGYPDKEHGYYEG
jgi:tyrosine-protein kinase Etk/Wzc